MSSIPPFLFQAIQIKRLRVTTIAIATVGRAITKRKVIYIRSKEAKIKKRIFPTLNILLRFRDYVDINFNINLGVRIRELNYFRLLTQLNVYRTKLNIYLLLVLIKNKFQLLFQLKLDNES